MGSQTKHTDTYKEDDGVQNEKATGRDGEKEANTERGRRRRAADACVEKIEMTSAANAGYLRAPRRGGRVEQGGFLLEAAVCFAAVKSHTGNVGKHIQADASADDDRLRRSRSLDGGGKKHSLSRRGFYAKHFITCARARRTCAFLSIRRRATFCFFPLDYIGGALVRVMRGMINVLTRSR